jgi:hypothetical protein
MARTNTHLPRAIAHLTEHGETRSCDLAKALDITAGTLVACLTRAVTRGEIVERTEGRSKFYSVGTSAATDDAPVRWAHWDDGDIVVYGLVENDDGSHTIPRAVVEQMRKRFAVAGV